MELQRRRTTITKVKIEEKEKRLRMVDSREETKASALNPSTPEEYLLDLFPPTLLDQNHSHAFCMRTSRHLVRLWMPLSKSRIRSFLKRMVVETP